MSGISNHYDSMVYIQGIIQAIISAGSLPNLVGGQMPVLIREVIDYKVPDVAKPHIQIAPFGPERYSGEDFNDRDDIGYGIAIAIIADADPATTPYTLETRLAWRQKIRRPLNNVPVNINGTIYVVKVEPRDVIEREAWFDASFMSGFVVRAWAEEPRS